MSLFRMSAMFRSHGFLRYSTAADPKTSGVLVDFLVDSLGLSKPAAISLSSKASLRHLKCTIGSDSVVNSFKNCGLTVTQITEIVYSAPKILCCHPENTLDANLRVFQKLGLSGSDLVNLVKRNPDVFWHDLHTRIIPGINLLKSLLGTDEKVAEYINNSRKLFCRNSFSMKILKNNVSLLQNIGLSNEGKLKFTLSNPDNLMVDPNILESRLNFVEHKLGISPDSKSFVQSVCLALYISDSDIERKTRLFRRYGWSDSDITLLFRNQLDCLNKSQDDIRLKLEFFMKDLGYTPAYLVEHHTFFTLNFSRRIMPRYKMLRILKEKNLVNDKPEFITIAAYPELKFLEFLRGYEKDIPGLCDIYNSG